MASQESDNLIFESFLGFPPEERRAALATPWVVDSLIRSVKAMPDYAQAPISQQADIFINMGLPLAKMELPDQAAMDPFTAPVPRSGIAVPLVSAQPTRSNPLAPTVNPSDIPETYRTISSLRTLQPSALAYGSAGTPEDTWYYKILRGLTSSVLPLPVRPPGVEAPPLEEAAKLGGVIIASFHPAMRAVGGVTGGTAAAGMRVAQRAVTGISSMITPAGAPQTIAQWLINQPALTRAVISAAYNFGSMGALEVTRDAISRGYREGKYTDQELQSTLGPTLYRDLIIGTPVALAIEAGIGGYKYYRAAKGLGQTLIGEVMQGVNSGALDAAATLDNVLWPTKTLISTTAKPGSREASVLISALAPEQTIRNTTTTLRGAMSGDHVVLKNGDWMQVRRHTDGGVFAQKVGPKGVSGAVTKIPYESETIERIEAVRGPIMRGQEVYDDSLQTVSTALRPTFVFDRYTSKTKAAVIDAQGKTHFKNVANLRTEVDEYTLRNAAQRARVGVYTPPPEGRLTWQDYKVLDVADDGTIKTTKYSSMDDVSIPYRSVTNPTSNLPHELSTLSYGLEPTIVLATMNRPETYELAKMYIDGAATQRGLLGEFHTMANSWQKSVGRTSHEASQRLTRAFAGVSTVEDNAFYLAASSQAAAEQRVLSEARTFAKKYLYPTLNAERAAQGLAPIANDFPIPFVLFPEIILNSGNQRLLSGVKLADVANMIRPTGIDNEVVLTGLGPSAVTKIDIKANFWDWLNTAMNYAAETAAFRATAQRSHELSQAFAKQGADFGTVQYLDWFAQFLKGRTSTAFLGEVLDHSKTMERVQSFLLNHPKIPFIGGTKSTAKIGNWSLESPKLPLREIDLYEGAATIKRWSYRATIGMSLNTARLNTTQTLTHVLPNLPGQSAEEIGRNVGDVAVGMAKGTGHMFLSFLQHWAPEASWMERMLSNKNLNFYRQSGVLSDFEEIFNPNIAKGGQLVAGLVNNFNALTFANMRATEILNRIATYDAVVNATTADMRRRGLAEVSNQPDVVAAISEHARTMTAMTQFLYGKGAKSMLHERGSIPNVATKLWKPSGLNRLAGPAAELLATYNTFTYKTLSLYHAEWQQLRRNHPNAIRAISSADSPDDFVRYMQELDSESRNQFWRTLAFRTATGAALATLFGLNSMFIDAFGVNFGLAHPVSATGRIVEKFQTQGPWGATKQAVREFSPWSTAYRRFQRGTTIVEKLVQTTPPHKERSLGAAIAEWLSGASGERR